MSESSGASFPGFGLEEVHNFPAMETVTGSGETPATLAFKLTLAKGKYGPSAPLSVSRGYLSADY